MPSLWSDPPVQYLTIGSPTQNFSSNPGPAELIGQVVLQNWTPITFTVTIMYILGLFKVQLLIFRRGLRDMLEVKLCLRCGSFWLKLGLLQFLFLEGRRCGFA
jgi:hypothetical protein